MEAKHPICDTVIQLSRQGQVQRAFEVIAAAQLTVSQAARLLCDLYVAGCYPVAFNLAITLGKHGVDHWVVDAVQAHVGIIAGTEDLSAKALGRLRARLKDMEPGDIALFQQMVAGKRLSNDLCGKDPVADAALVMRLLEVARLALPPLEDVFPAQAGAVRWDGPTAGPHPDLIKMPAPRDPATRRARTVLVATLDEDSAGGLGARLKTSLDGYGWRASVRTLRTQGTPADLASDLAGVRDECLRDRPDLLILTESGGDRDLEMRLSFLSDLRTRRPETRVVLFLPDPWCRDRWPAFRRAAAHADRVWSPFPSVALWREQAFASKMSFQPLPMGPARPLPMIDGPLRPSLQGRIHRWAWVRAFWLAAGREAGLDLSRPELTRPPAEGAFIPYDRYLDSLGAAGAAINLTMRVDGTPTLVGRSFEIPWAGALLVEEDNPDIRFYFQEGRHMVTFSTLPEGHLEKRLAPDPVLIESGQV